MTDTTTAPSLTAIAATARSLLAEHGLTAQGWTFGWDRAVKRAGCCHYTTKRVTLSAPIFDLSEHARSEATDTILHEIAHALAGPGTGHGWQWKQTARRIGCNGSRCHALPTPPRAIVGTCRPGCAATRDRASFPKPGVRYRCRLCRTEITWARRDGRSPAAVKVAAARRKPTSKGSAAARKAWATRRRNAARAAFDVV